MNVTEHAVPSEDTVRLTVFASKIRAQLSEQGLPAHGTTEWADAFVYDWQQSGKPATDAIESDELIYALGIVWGSEVVDAFGWAWVDLTFHEFDDWVGRAVVSADRSLMILPFAHIHECIAGEDEVKIGASVTAIDSNIIPKFDRHSYTNVMHGLQRIIPR